MSHMVNNLNLEEEEEKVGFQRNITYHWLVFLWLQRSEPEAHILRRSIANLDTGHGDDRTGLGG